MQTPIALANAAPLPVVVKLLAARNSRGPAGAKRPAEAPPLSCVTVAPPMRPEIGPLTQFNTERGSDVQLTVTEPDGTRTVFWCHRAILSAGCRFYDTHFTGNRDPRFSTRLIRAQVGLPCGAAPHATAASVRALLCWLYGQRFPADHALLLSLHALALDLGCAALAARCAETATDYRLLRPENAVRGYTTASEARHGQPLAAACWRWIVQNATQIADCGPSAVGELSTFTARQLISAVSSTTTKRPRRRFDGGNDASLAALKIAVHWAAAATRKLSDVSEVFGGCTWHAGAGNLFPALAGGMGYGEEDGVLEPITQAHQPLDSLIEASPGAVQISLTHIQDAQPSQ